MIQAAPYDIIIKASISMSADYAHHLEVLHMGLTRALQSIDHCHRHTPCLSTVPSTVLLPPWKPNSETACMSGAVHTHPPRAQHSDVCLYVLPVTVMFVQWVVRAVVLLDAELKHRLNAADAMHNRTFININNNNDNNMTTYKAL